MLLEDIFSAIASACALICSYVFGSWTFSLTLLILLMIFDYATGVGASYYEAKIGKGKGLCSKLGFIGILRKLLIFLVISILHQLDSLLGTVGTITFMAAGVYFYISNELISVIENLGRLGVPIPQALKNAVEVLREKAGEETAEEECTEEEYAEEEFIEEEYTEEEYTEEEETYYY